MAVEPYLRVTVNGKDVAVTLYKHKSESAENWT
jgi:hypothetical protein